MEFLKSNIDTFIEIIVIIFVIIASIKIIDFFDRKVRENIRKRHENSARLLSFCPILSKIAKTVVMLIIAASVMQAHGYSMTSLVAGFGIIGMAVSFAAKESIANIFGSFAILYDKIFDLGDYVVIDSIEGTVVDITLRSTKIRTVDNTIITLPNNVVANAVVTNISAIKERRLGATIGVTYDTSNEKLQRAIQILKDILTSNEDVSENYRVFLKELNASSIDIEFTAYIKYGDLDNFRRVREAVLTEIITQYRKEGIDFAFPSQSIYVTNEN